MSRTSRAGLALLLTCAAISPASATIFIFTGHATGTQEFPPNASPGTGDVIVTLDDALHTLRFQVSFVGLIGTTTASHVHAPINPVTGNGPIATELPSFTGFPLGVMSGTYDHTFDTTLLATWNPGFVANNGGTALGAELGFLNAMQAGLAYLNIHSTFAPGGEIRANLQAAVPEPSTWMMMLGGFAAAGLVIRRRRKAGLATT